MLYTRLISLLLLLLIVFPVAVFARDVEIDGLYLNNSKTRQGHEFAYQFGLLWQEMPNTQGINVQITEQIVPHAGTKLTLLMNHKLVYVTYLGRRRSPMKNKVEQAIFALIDAMAQAKLNRRTPDMAENGW
ncbi:curli production assembly protein CsgE [Thalassomonas viridans]|uniref:Curli production assembly/transport component CsgE n=1 Tax=Thalassomonas viridans TaxID=137584 RepID=A0AAE9Z9B6_9GAMM|nr:CsgE family curli-type amyloid fiber assembly protein [Thalassomonas viridans]WDE08632.1 curli production assembly protein CsgE [Thalassomonas viridans]